MKIPVLVKRGAAGTTTLAENVEALPAERYRVEKYLIASPADVDGDCIDDITELDDFGTMNPVNSAGSVDFSDGAAGIPEGVHVEVSVADEGRGIPAEQLPHLFRKFSRVEPDDPGGDTGLGLAICKGIVEAHGGRIWAESDGPGLGPRFTFTVPAVEEAASERHRPAVVVVGVTVILSTSFATEAV